MNRFFQKRKAIAVIALAVWAVLLAGCGAKQVTIRFPENTEITAAAGEGVRVENQGDALVLTVSKNGTYTVECTEATAGDFTLAVTCKGNSVSLDQNGSGLDTAVSVD